MSCKCEICSGQHLTKDHEKATGQSVSNELKAFHPNIEQYIKAVQRLWQGARDVKRDDQTLRWLANEGGLLLTEPNLVHTNKPMHKILPILVKDDNGNEFLLKNFQQVLDMMEEIEQLKSNPEYSYEAKTEWISVDDRLPEENTWSIVYAKHRPDVDGIVCLNPFKNGKFSEYTAVTHWQPLPDIPNCDEVKK